MLGDLVENFVLRVEVHCNLVRLDMLLVVGDMLGEVLIPAPPLAHKVRA